MAYIDKFMVHRPFNPSFTFFNKYKIFTTKGDFKPFTFFLHFMIAEVQHISLYIFFLILSLREKKKTISIGIFIFSMNYTESIEIVQLSLF